MREKGDREERTRGVKQNTIYKGVRKKKKRRNVRWKLFTSVYKGKTLYLKMYIHRLEEKGSLAQNSEL